MGSKEKIKPASVINPSEKMIWIMGNLEDWEDILKILGAEPLGSTPKNGEEKGVFT